MKTIIELYDERPIENVLGAEVFRPKELVILCPAEVESTNVLAKSLRKYFEHRGCPIKVTVVPVSLLDARKVEKQLRRVIETREDCVIDISGGTDAALFAAGCVDPDVPVITYSRKKNTFFEIRNAPYARNLPCNVHLDAESCFLMAGGTMLPGREDNETLRDRLDEIDRLFSVFKKHRRTWNRQISYIQQISSSEPGELLAEGALTVKSGRGNVTVEEELLLDLANENLIHDLVLTDQSVSFRFPDEMVRFWLRDIGSVLELQVYRSAVLAGCFDDVVLSAVVNWEGGTSQRDAVTNEIDVVAVRGISPVFISCKTSEIRTEALNELAVLRDRFGGKGSRAIIVTSANPSRGRALMRMRATELDIEVVEWSDVQTERLVTRLQMKV